MTNAAPAHKRILLKLSGEALMGDDAFGINRNTIVRMVQEVVDVTRLGVQVAVVIGGGNIFRGVAGGAEGMDRATADYMGMLATVMNALAVQDALEKLGVTTRVMTAIDMKEVAEPYIRRRAMHHLEKGRVVIFAAGTGSPYFSTDTAAALRAAEMGMDCLLKATKVDGIYSEDPKKNPEAVLLHRLTYMDALSRQFQIMDAVAFSLCMENAIPIVVLNILKKGTMKNFLVHDMKTGTIVSTEEEN